MAHLRPVPDAPLRALGLVRVSKERDEMISPELQRTAIVDHCARRGFELVGWVEGIDESGSKRRSPWWARLDQAVGRVETGDVDALVVWRFSRTARQRLRWAVAIDRVEVAGGILESATEPLDTSTASGRLARGMLAEMAAYESEVIGATWRETHARRTRAGLPPNGKPRFGYRVVDGLHRPYEPEAAVLAELYRRYVAGESIRSLATWLNREGIRTVPGYSRKGPGDWATTALLRVLDSGFAAGLLHSAHGHQQGAHEPIITQELWEAYRAARVARRRLRRSEVSPYLLSGMVRCAYPMSDGETCGSSMGGGIAGSGRAKQPAFRCNAVQQMHRHSGGLVLMRIVEADVLDWLREVASEVEASADAAAAQTARITRRKVDARQLAREVLRLDEALARLEVNRAVDPIGLVHVYESARAELLAQRDAADQRRLAAEVEARQGEPAKAAAALLNDWDELSLEQRRGSLRQLIARIEVVPGRPRATVRVVPRWEV